MVVAGNKTKRLSLVNHAIKTTPRPRPPPPPHQHHHHHQLMQISLSFKTSCCYLKISGLGAKLCVTFLLF